MYSKKLCFVLGGLGLALIPVVSVFGQEAPPPPAAETTNQPKTAAAEKSEVVVLSPFVVSTDKDRGYRATNSISGTRLDTAIRDVPMPIEVITEQFLRDTGANDLRQSLRYSAGILLQTQNDFGAPAGSFAVTPGKINNPEGLTGSPDQTHMKIRGFETESVLRDGFRRQNATDSVNIARVEVARGPASLLYGVGNFGGVVNYLTKMPETKQSAEVTAAYGSYDFKRATLDATGPFTDTVAYRLTAVWQDQNSYTDFNTEQHYFVSPVITWKPFPGTEILLDLELGHQKQSGISWQDLRAAVSGYINEAGGYNGTFYNIPGKSVRTFRWSGPDTYRNSDSSNIEFKIDQKITDDLHFLAGFDHSTFNFKQLDNMAAFATNPSGVAADLVAPVVYQGLIHTQSGLPVGPQPSTIAYQWEKHDQDNKHDQMRVELNYDLKLFQNSSKWLKMDHSFLFGLSYTKEVTEDHTRQTPGDQVNYHSPADYSYFRFGKWGNGTSDWAMVENDNTKNTTQNPAYYAVYQGKLLDDRVTGIIGIRKDRSWNKYWQYSPEFYSDGTRRGDTTPSEVYATPSKDTTYQYGVDVRITRDLSAYAMHSEGVEPNYQGKLDLYGNPLQAALAKNNEVGLKFDLFKGKISGTLSKFEIIRSRTQIGSSSLVWFAPVAAKTTHFNPSKDIVYNVNDLNPYNNDWNAAVVDSTAQWNAAVVAGAVYQATNSGGSTNWYANASKPTGAALLDAVFANVAKENQYGWWGWIYAGADPGSLPFDNLVNNATMDDNGAQKSVATGTDKSKGWDTQIIIQPIDNLQILVSWSHINKVVVHAQAWPRYPYPQDRWAIWYAPISWSATAGRPLNQVYRDPQDTSTFIAFGDGLPMDDTPKDQASFWLNYQFPKDSSLKGLSMGVGGFYESQRLVYPAYGQNALDSNGNTIFLNTPSKTNYSAMVKYAFKLKNHDASVQLNVDNVTNDIKLYGFIYNAPRRWQLTFSYKL